MAGQAIWAKLFYLIRTGHAEDALVEAIQNQSSIDNRENSFVSHLRAWVESADRK